MIFLERECYSFRNEEKSSSREVVTMLLEFKESQQVSQNDNFCSYCSTVLRNRSRTKGIREFLLFHRIGSMHHQTQFECYFNACSFEYPVHVTIGYSRMRRYSLFFVSKGGMELARQSCPFIRPYKKHPMRISGAL